MKKPRKKKYSSDVINEEDIYSLQDIFNFNYNCGFETANKYHEWDKKQNYVRKDRVGAEKIEKILEANWNHLFSPEENYIGRLNLATELSKELKREG